MTLPLTRAIAPQLAALSLVAAEVEVQAEVGAVECRKTPESNFPSARPIRPY